MTPRPWVNRECSAVGKTHRALWSWLIRRSRWSQAVSRRSSSATSSSGSPAADASSLRQSLGQLHVAVDGIADQVDRGERVASHARVSGHPDAHLGCPRPEVAGGIASRDSDSVVVAVGSIRRRISRVKVVADPMVVHEPVVHPGLHDIARDARCPASGGSRPSRARSTSRRRRSRVTLTIAAPGGERSGPSIRTTSPNVLWELDR